MFPYTGRQPVVFVHVHTHSFVSKDFVHLNYKTAPVTYNVTSLHVGKDKNSVEGTVISLARSYTLT